MPTISTVVLILLVYPIVHYSFAFICSPLQMIEPQASPSPLYTNYESNVHSLFCAHHIIFLQKMPLRNWHAGAMTGNYCAEPVNAELCFWRPSALMRKPSSVPLFGQRRRTGYGPRPEIPHSSAPQFILRDVSNIPNGLWIFVLPGLLSALGARCSVCAAGMYWDTPGC